MKKIFTICTCVFIAVILTLSISAKTVKLGDVNGDGRITASDARKILRFAATLEACDEETAVIADADKNGKISASDARKVLRVAATLDSELGEITLGEEETTVQRTEVKDAIGMTVTSFIKQFGSMSKDGTSDGTVMYHNDQLIIVSDPKMIDDTKINSVTVTGDSYTLNGIFAGIASADAERILLNDGWRIKNTDSSVVTFSKNSDLMKITVRNGNISQVELCLAVSIATQKPDEETTQEVTTQPPVVTPPEETTAPDEETTVPDKNDSLSIEDLPSQLRSFLSGTFGFTGTIPDNSADDGPKDVTIYTNGRDVSMDLSMEMSDNKMTDVRVLIVYEDNKDEPKMYMLNHANKKYASFDPSYFGGSIDNFKFNVNVGDLNTSEITLDTQTVEGTEYEVYTVKTPTGITRIYTVNEEIKRVSSFDLNNNHLSTIEISSFYTELPENIFSYSQYKKVISFFLLFI